MPGGNRTTLLGGPCVVGIDLSTHAIDLVALDENANHAHWHRIPLTGENAWDRTRHVRQNMPGDSFWDNVYLAAIEKPQSRGFKTAVALMRVQGAILASIPSHIHVWEVTPQDWKRALGISLAVKPTLPDIAKVAGGMHLDARGSDSELVQDALDALGVALYARDTNAAAIGAALNQ